MEEEILTCFEVETYYKSGRIRSQVIISKDEESMWKFYNKHHDASKIESSAIVDSWPQ